MDHKRGSLVVAALRTLAWHVGRWRLLYLWEYLQFDAKAEPNRPIGAHQNASAALRGISHQLGHQLLGPVELASLLVVRDGEDSAAWDESSG
jgi:hypothetical protein